MLNPEWDWQEEASNHLKRMTQTFSRHGGQFGDSTVRLSEGKWGVFVTVESNTE